MTRRTKRHWSPTQTEEFIRTVAAARSSVFQLMAIAPIGSPEYRALSAFLDAILQAAIFLDRDWTKPEPSRAGRE
ncbi:hypothetical protein [Xanthobacter sp. 126]|uniref:hypothetical protein n=1 Tax=Xanthobacter sp. 126 TaxID=1131814 RepID=UPI00045EC2A8|nr:hypothetical protein [Xanthobacter sp. 126]